MYTLDKILLKLDNISLKFGNKQILRDINLEVKDIVGTTQTLGQVITLLGRSGVGKTQLMKIIAGLSHPTTGDVYVGLDQRKVMPGIVGMVLQTYPLFTHRTVLSNLKLVSNDKAKIEQYLHDFDVWEQRDKYPSQLSGGQRQRSAIVQQLLCSKHFILLDEPFSGLDPVSTEKLIKAINKVANYDSYNTVIISSHILEPALAISDSVYMMGHSIVTDAKGEVKVPGAYLKHYFDLAANGMAWNPEIRRDTKFISLVEDIRKIFQTL